MKTRRKNYIFFLIILISLISIIWFLQISKAKYKGQSEIELAITATPLYCEHTGQDISIPYNNNTANMHLTVHNYIGNNYTIEDIDYTISIETSNYTFAIDEINLASDNNVPLVLEGGARNSQTLNLKFNRTDTTNVPDKETFPVTISATYPYEYSSTFNVTITNGAIDVKGNPTNWTKDDVTLTIVPTTEGTQLVEYSFDNGATWTNNASKVYTKNTSNIIIYAKDNIGGILGPVEVNITRIDKTVPEFNVEKDIEYNTDETTKEVETLVVYLGEKTSVLKNISATDAQSGISGEGIKCYKGEQEITTTDYFTNAGRYNVTYKVNDEVGNEQTVNREILVRWPLAGKYVLARQDIVGTGSSTLEIGSGLYKDDASTGYDSTLPYCSKYYYSGDLVDNYVSFSDTTFRILNVADNDTIKLIAPLSDKSYGYEAWYSKLFRTSFYKSWAKDWIPNNRIYDSGDKNHISIDMTSENSHVDNATFYAGVMSREEKFTIADLINEERTNDTKISGGTSVDFKSKVALPTVSDYLKANGSLNTIYNIRLTQGTYNDTNSKIFKEKSFLGTDTQQFTMTGTPGGVSNDFWVLIPNTGNEILSRTGYYNQKVRAVIYLKNDTILSGTGTEQDPFTVKENWAWFDPYQEAQ